MSFEAFAQLEKSERKQRREMIWNLANLMRAKRLPNGETFIMEKGYENKTEVLSGNKAEEMTADFEKMKEEMQAN